ncbi:MAG: hypothetical protein H6831_08755 [Planctomycetes bacterium]|nr:hypothetical protein [Planctomycetota bacterium]
MRRDLARQAVRMRRRRDARFPDFLSAVARALPERTGHARFEFIAYRLWHSIESDDETDIPSEIIRRRYGEFERSFQWTVSGADTEFTPELIVKTLTFWQSRVPTDMTAQHALDLLRRTRASLLPSEG